MSSHELSIQLIHHYPNYLLGKDTYKKNTDLHQVGIKFVSGVIGLHNQATFYH